MIEFVETPLFSRLVNAYLSDEELAALQWELAKNETENIPAHVLRAIEETLNHD